MNVAAQKKGLAYSIPWRLVCRGRGNKALDLETPPGGRENYPASSEKTPSEAILCVHSILNVYQKKQGGNGAWMAFLFIPIHSLVPFRHT